VPHRSAAPRPSLCSFSPGECEKVAHTSIATIAKRPMPSIGSGRPLAVAVRRWIDNCDGSGVRPDHRRRRQGRDHRRGEGLSAPRARGSPTPPRRMRKRRVPANGLLGAAARTRLHKRSSAAISDKAQVDRPLACATEQAAPASYRHARMCARRRASRVWSLALREAFQSGAAGASALASPVMHQALVRGVVSSCHFRRRWWICFVTRGAGFPHSGAVCPSAGWLDDAARSVAWARTLAEPLRRRLRLLGE
jgi:hypothetical protein